jgi:hypothetical protein
MGSGNENPPELFATCPGNPTVCGMRRRAAGLLCADNACFTPAPDPDFDFDLLLEDFVFPAI